MVTAAQLKAIMPYSGHRADEYCDVLNSAMEEFEINTPMRQAAFLAQIAHESAQFAYTKELASGVDYDRRGDLGNLRSAAIEIAKDHGTTPGRFFKGRGLIQITGYDNYVAMMLALDIDCVQNPDLLCEEEGACRSAACFWKAHRLNELADAGEFETITRRINGGLNGYTERCEFYRRAKEILC